MRTIVIAAPKGGVGKTTLTLSLGCLAASKNLRVALLDFDHGQASLAKWWQRRGSPDNPMLGSQHAGFADAKEKLELFGIDWVFVDTSPNDYDVIEDCVTHADFVIVPVQPAFIDAESTLDLMDMLKGKRIPYGYVLNRANEREKLTKTVDEYIQQKGHPRMGLVVDRASFRTAHTKGETATEVERDGKAADELGALWEAIRARVSREPTHV